MKSNIKEKEVKINNYSRLETVPFRSGIEILKQIQRNGAVIFGAMGKMGSASTSTFLRADIPTTMQDIDSDGLRQSGVDALISIEKGAKKRKIAPEQAAQIRNRGLLRDSVTFPERGKIPFEEIAKAHAESEEKSKAVINDFLNTAIPNKHLKNEYTDVMMVLEAGPEILGFKQGVFEFFEGALKSNKAIIATNTSSLKVEDIAKKVDYPERVVGFHYFLPADINTLLEIIATPETSPEVIDAMRHLAHAMGKKPIVCWKDSSGATANRILVGVLNEAAKIYDAGIAEAKTIDNIFLETFYPDQITIKSRRVQNQFQAAPKISFFNDEKSLYRKIAGIDKEIQEAKTQNEKEALCAKKEDAIKQVLGSLTQKSLYAQIVENHGELGEFFRPAPSVLKVKDLTKKQIQIVREYLTEVQKDRSNLEKPFVLDPYRFPASASELKPQNEKTKQTVKDRLLGAYIAICMQIYNEGLSDIQDIEIACKEGFKWNIGPFELAKNLGAERSYELVKLVNEGLQTNKTGILSVENIIEPTEEDLSGVRTYIRDGIGFIELGKLHVQYLQMMQNSLSPHTLRALNKAVKELECDDRVKTIFFTSQGGGPFSAGADLAYVSKHNWNYEKTLEYVDYGYEVIMGSIYNCKKPTVAFLDGLAIGGGAELASACDFRFGTYESGVAFPEVNLVHIFPAWGGVETFPRIVGKKLAEAVMVPPTKRGIVILGAKHAQEVGYFDKVVLQSDLPALQADLISGNVSGIDIYTKPERKRNFNKNDYSPEIIQKYNIDKLNKPKLRIFSSGSARLTKELIAKSDGELPEISISERKKVVFAGWRRSKFQIGPMIWAVQNKYAAKLLDLLGMG